MAYIITAEYPGRDSAKEGDWMITGDAAWLLLEMCGPTGGMTSESFKKADIKIPKILPDYLLYIKTKHHEHWHCRSRHPQSKQWVYGTQWTDSDFYDARHFLAKLVELKAKIISMG